MSTGRSGPTPPPFMFRRRRYGVHRGLDRNARLGVGTAGTSRYFADRREVPKPEGQGGRKGATRRGGVSGRRLDVG